MSEATETSGAATTPTAKSERPKTRRAVVGRVTSDRMDKTITVRCDRMVQHPRFKKYVKRSTLYKAHDESNEAHVGDRVEIMECRPLSKTKRFRLLRIIERSALRGVGRLAKDVAGDLTEEG